VSDEASRGARGGAAAGAAGGGGAPPGGAGAPPGGAGAPAPGGARDADSSPLQRALRAMIAASGGAGAAGELAGEAERSALLLLGERAARGGASATDARALARYGARPGALAAAAAADARFFAVDAVEGACDDDASSGEEDARAARAGEGGADGGAREEAALAAGSARTALFRRARLLPERPPRERPPPSPLDDERGDAKALTLCEGAAALARMAATAASLLPSDGTLARMAADPWPPMSPHSDARFLTVMPDAASEGALVELIALARAGEGGSAAAASPALRDAALVLLARLRAHTEYAFCRAAQRDASEAEAPSPAPPRGDASAGARAGGAAPSGATPSDGDSRLASASRALTFAFGVGGASSAAAGAARFPIGGGALLRVSLSLGEDEPALVCLAALAFLGAGAEERMGSLLDAVMADAPAGRGEAAASAARLLAALAALALRAAAKEQPSPPRAPQARGVEKHAAPLARLLLATLRRLLADDPTEGRSGGGGREGAATPGAGRAAADALVAPLLEPT
jgi:hypothetical protein